MTDQATPQQTNDVSSPSPSVLLPRVTIRFCTQCKWMLRAAYFAQELLSTFSTALGEVALQPATGGVFVVEIVTGNNSILDGTTTAGTGDGNDGQIQQRRVVLWDRKTDGGFPETKELKRRVRDVIQPGRDLGHVDRHHGPTKSEGDKAHQEERKKTGPDNGNGQGSTSCVPGGGDGGEQQGKCEDCN